MRLFTRYILREVISHALLGSIVCFAGSGTLSAQTSLSHQLSPEEARRVEVLVRSKVDLPPMTTVHVGPRSQGDLPGFDRVTVTYTAEGQTSPPISFLLSTDGKTVAQFDRFDVGADPRTAISEEHRPARGGTESAPVHIVNFDDLECPFCARLNAVIPAVLERYKDQVRFVNRDDPSDGHPWAVRAAIDSDCLGHVSTAAFWNTIDTIHREAADLGGSEHSLAAANASIDTIVREAASKDHVDPTVVNACLAKQDETAVRKSQREAQALGIVRTPTLFINGAKIEGAVPVEFLFEMIDNALLAQGITPPPALSKAIKPKAPDGTLN